MPLKFTRGNDFSFQFSGARGGTVGPFDIKVLAEIIIQHAKSTDKAPWCAMLHDKAAIALLAEFM